MVSHRRDTRQVQEPVLHIRVNHLGQFHCQGAGSDLTVPSFQVGIHMDIHVVIHCHPSIGDLSRVVVVHHHHFYIVNFNLQ